MFLFRFFSSSGYSGYSGSGSGSGYLGNFYDGYSENTDIDYGISSYVHDQLFSPKDQWDERILSFQTKFKNETV